MRLEESKVRGGGVKLHCLRQQSRLKRWGSLRNPHNGMDLLGPAQTKQSVYFISVSTPSLSPSSRNPVLISSIRCAGMPSLGSASTLTVTLSPARSFYDAVPKSVRPIAKAIFLRCCRTASGSSRSRDWTTITLYPSNSSACLII